MKTYVADDNESKLIALRMFVRDGINNDAHKKTVRKFKIARWDHGMWVITPEAKAHAESLGLL